MWIKKMIWEYSQKLGRQIYFEANSTHTILPPGGGPTLLPSLYMWVISFHLLFATLAPSTSLSSHLLDFHFTHDRRQQ